MRRRAFLDRERMTGVGAGDEVVLPPDAGHHLSRVIRLKAGAEVELFDGSGRLLVGRFEPGPPARVLDVREEQAEDPLPPLVVAQALTRNQKLEQVVQRSTELGASKILLFEAGRSAVRLGKGAGRRQERLERIAQEAARQCLRVTVPAVEPPIAFPALCEEVDLFPGVRAVGLVDAGGALSQVLAESAAFPAAGMLLVVGPEGGLSSDEAGALLAAGAQAVRLGVHVVRTETAALTGLAAAQAALGRL